MNKKIISAVTNINNITDSELPIETLQSNFKSQKWQKKVIANIKVRLRAGYDFLNSAQH